MIRGKNLFLSWQTMRSLQWASKALNIECADALAEQWLADRLALEFPKLASIADGFDRERSKLESEAIKKLSEKTP